ncbi:MAG: glycosyltransferase, partial [Planctomycetota bacterium]
MLLAKILVFAHFSILALLSVYGVHRFYMLFLYYFHKKNQRKPLRLYDEVPTLTVQLPTFNEVYVVERLIDAVAKMDYPRDRFQVQVLDDSTDDTTEVAARKVEEWRRRGLDIELIHRVDRGGFKAGALENGLKTAKGEFVAIFDADFVPTPNCLLDNIHFFTDPKIAMVQFRWVHINEGYSLLTRVQSILLDGHFVIEHTARNRSGRFFNFNGTAGVWRRTAIADAGGWQHDTLTEDLDLSYRAQLRGWQFVFLPHVPAPSEVPVEMNAFKAQ